MKEEDIRPRKIFEEYLNLAAQDAIKYFPRKSREVINCPACGAVGSPAFEKNGFDYQKCPKCLTLFVSPRPLEHCFSEFYTVSASAHFWAEVFYKKTVYERREKLWKPKALEISEILSTYCTEYKPLIVDIGGGYGIFSEEMRNLGYEDQLIIEPNCALADVCVSKKFKVIPKFLENVSKKDLPEGLKVFTSFELFEHLHNPQRFLDVLFRLMDPGDFFIFTTLNGNGLDIACLQEHSKSVTPPQHINFFNPHSVSVLLEKLGFNLINVETPGKLDIDILSKDADLLNDQFWKSVLFYADDRTKQDLQRVVVQNLWSSHMRIVAMKS